MLRYLLIGAMTGFVVLAVSLCGTNAYAGMMTPAAVADHSGTEAAPYTADKIIDGIAGPGGDRNMAVFTDDSDPTGSGTYWTTPITGHIILDLGEQIMSDALQIWARNDTSEELMAKSVDIFFYVDDDWSNNAVLDDIENDDDIVSVWSGDLQSIVSGEDQTVTFTTEATARYLGIRVNSSYGWDSFQINEFAVNVVPEPGVMALLLCGAAGIMMIRRKR